jgi:hypothetical protein
MRRQILSRLAQVGTAALLLCAAAAQADETATEKEQRIGAVLPAFAVAGTVGDLSVRRSALAVGVPAKQPLADGRFYIEYRGKAGEEVEVELFWFDSAEELKEGVSKLARRCDTPKLAEVGGSKVISCPESDNEDALLWSNGRNVAALIRSGRPGGIPEQLAGAYLGRIPSAVTAEDVPAAKLDDILTVHQE